MPTPHVERPELPSTMTWEELGQLPPEVADFVELRDGTPVWIADEVLLRHGPAEHQRYSRRFANALEREARAHMSTDHDVCWQVDQETNVFFRPDKSSFLTPDFMIFRCLRDEFGWVFAEDVLLAGEVLSPANTPKSIEEKKRRYAEGGIAWYWEVELAPNPRRVAVVRAYALSTDEVRLPQGVTPLRRANYILTGEWIADEHTGVQTTHPFTIDIPWTDLAF
ncbi:Uma2 family endonuclease [Nocardia rhizosphaerae]|uniref:Uma2 family endonuclease n=1 Tax=Nocardia rhizosphaerae TaxID=1691571 RepID=A0ABV8L656_9NOCA